MAVRVLIAVIAFSQEIYYYASSSFNFENRWCCSGTINQHSILTWAGQDLFQIVYAFQCHPSVERKVEKLEIAQTVMFLAIKSMLTSFVGLLNFPLNYLAKLWLKDRRLLSPMPQKQENQSVMPRCLENSFLMRLIRRLGMFDYEIMLQWSMY